MKEEAKKFLNDDLESFENKLSMIVLSDPEKYKEFSDRLNTIQGNLIGISEIELERTKADIVAGIVRIQSDFDAYMNGNDVSSIMNEVTGAGRIESGKAKLKKYKLNLYFSIIDDLCKLDEIKITDIDVLKDKWMDDVLDEYLDFSPFEISAMNEKMAKVFLEYQIKYIQKNGRLPAEQIEDYTNKEDYAKMIKDKIVELHATGKITGISGLLTDSFLRTEDFNTLVNNPVLWEILSGKKFYFDQKRMQSILGLDEKKEEKSLVKQEEPKQEELALTVPNKRISTKHMTCVIKKTNKFFNKGKVSYKTVNVRIRNGIAKLPDKLRDKIVEAYIPEGVVAIHEQGFFNCQHLKKVVLPKTLRVIGDEAFRNCFRLEDMELPEGLKKIGVRGLYYCSSLKNAVIPKSIERILDEACETVPFKTLNLSENLGELGERAFSLCDELEEVTFEGSLGSIPKQCFANCRKLKRFTFPKGILRICEDAFAGCRELTDFTNIPDSVRVIEKYALIKAEKIRLPSDLQRMERQALHTKEDKLELIMPPDCNKIEAVTALQENADIKLTFPEEFTGNTYRELGINEGDVITLRELRKRKAIRENEKRNEYLEAYYGADAYKYKREYVDEEDVIE